VLADVWIDPGSTPRDLFWGIGGQEYAPKPDAIYTIKQRDASGFSVSYDLVDQDGVEWSAKLGPEAQTETAVSRILWGLGYHQPPLYYVPTWKAANPGDEADLGGEARLRPHLKRLKHLDEPWRWTDNPFLGATEFRGMLVVMLMLNSTDLKDSNNAVYQIDGSWDGATRWFLVRDVGAALGQTGKLYPRRNWIDGFERQGFIKSVEGRRVTFDYNGLHQEILGMIAPEDVRWAAERLQRLTDAQWRDAFRAGGYDEAATERYVRRIKEKIDDGLALRVDARFARAG
jgi:hypothetical protein